VTLTSARGSTKGLSALHERLEAHFGSLRTRRDDRGRGAPIFALEHGLSEAELALLTAEVQLAVRRGQLPEKSPEADENGVGSRARLPARPR
jgi:hypothetical protein